MTIVVHHGISKLMCINSKNFCISPTGVLLPNPMLSRVASPFACTFTIFSTISSIGVGGSIYINHRLINNKWEGFYVNFYIFSFLTYNYTKSD